MIFILNFVIKIFAFIYFLKYLIMGIISAILLHQANYTKLMWTSILFSIGTLWSLGIMHNYATEIAKKRKSYTGDFFDFEKDEVIDVPNWISRINMFFSLSSFVLLIVSIVIII